MSGHHTLTQARYNWHDHLGRWSARVSTGKADVSMRAGSALRREGRRRGRACAPGGTVQGAAFGGVKIYGMLKFGRYWRIGVCIADSNILYPLVSQFWDHIRNCQCSTNPHKAVCTPGNLHCWYDWSFTCCKTVEDPYCPVTVLLGIAIQCFALFTCIQILRKIWKFCMKFGHLILKKICKFVATGCHKAKNAPNSISAGAPPQTQLGSLQSSPGRS